MATTTEKVWKSVNKYGSDIGKIAKYEEYANITKATRGLE